MSPMRSPASSFWPAATRHTIRRATTPAICTTVTRALSLWMRIVQRSFTSAASGVYAATNLPRVYAVSTTRPASGARLTCTSSGERKIDTRMAAPTNGSTASSTDVTVPSAGDRTALPMAGTARSGSRKNPSDASEAAANGSASFRRPIRASATAIAPGTMTKGQPSRAIGSFPSITSLARRLDPRHHRAEPLADFLDLVVGVPPAHREESRAVRRVLEHPLARELPGLDLGEDFLHLVLRLVRHHAGTARVVAVLRGVGDGVPHVREAALVEEVDDQLHLVHALEVRHLGLVAGLDERLERGLDEVRDAAAERRLLAEEVRLRLFLERRLDDPGARAADALAVRERHVTRLARHVLVDGDEGGHAGALREEVAHDVARRLGRDHRDVDVRRRDDLVEVDVEAVGEHQHLALAEALLDLRLEDVPLALVGQQDHHDVGHLRGVRDGRDLQAFLLRAAPALRALVEADHDVLAGVLQVQRVRVALAAVADDGDLLALQQSEVRVLVVIDLRGHVPFPFLIGEADHSRIFHGACSLGLFDLARGFRPRPARDGHPAGADDLLDAHRPEQLDERLDLSLVARRLQDEGDRRDVDDLGAEDVAHAQDLRAVLRLRVHAHEHELALDVAVVREVAHLDDVDELVQLLHHLLDHELVARRLQDEGD